MAIGKKFQYPYPSVAPIAMPPPSFPLCIEQHLMHIFAGAVPVFPETYHIPVLVAVSDMTADGEQDIGRRENQLVPDPPVHNWRPTAGSALCRYGSDPNSGNYA